MTFKEIAKLIKKRIKAPRWSQEEVNGFLNQAIESLQSWCFIPGCHKKFKNHHGVMVHIAKFHKISRKDIVNQVVTSIKS